MADIFLSYASEDRARAARLAAALEVRGWSLWWDRQIGPGKMFDTVIEGELSRAGCVVVLWSEASVSSEWVRNEAAVAAERDVLIPARIDGVRLPLEFRRRQSIDLVGWNGDAGHPGFDALGKAVAAAVGAHASPAPAVPAGSAPWRHPQRPWARVALAVAVVAALGGAFLSMRVDVDKLDAKLVAAARKGEAAAVRSLLGKGARVRPAGARALTEAAASRHNGEQSDVSEAEQVATLQALLGAGVDPNARDGQGATALMLVVAGEAASPSAAKALLDRGADVHAKCDCSMCDPRSGSHGCNALMTAASAGHRKLVAMLLDKGAAVNDPTDEGRTALMLTSKADIVRALLQKGAAADLRDTRGRTALIWATLGLGVEEGVVQALLEAGADVGSTDKDGLTALAGAAMLGDAEIVRMLLDKGADVNAKTTRGMTPLMLATVNQHAALVRTLVARGPALREKNIAGKTALDLARERLQGETRDEIVYALQQASAKR